MALRFIWAKQISIEINDGTPLNTNSPTLLLNIILGRKTSSYFWVLIEVSYINLLIFYGLFSIDCLCDNKESKHKTYIYAVYTGNDYLNVKSLLVLRSPLYNRWLFDCFSAYLTMCEPYYRVISTLINGILTSRKLY